MSEHTKGDWSIEFRDSQTRGVNVCFSILCEAGSTICGGQSQEHLGDGYILESECRANARLIAAAPELLAALKEAHAVLMLAEQSGDEGVSDVLGTIRAAIAKAES